MKMPILEAPTISRSELADVPEPMVRVPGGPFEMGSANGGEFEQPVHIAWCGKVLATEAQWEKAARGGLVGRQCPWGDETPDGSQCNFARPAGETPGTAATKAFPPNDYGLFDMVGNIWQWCRDRYGASYYAEAPVANPCGAREGESRNPRPNRRGRALRELPLLPEPKLDARSRFDARPQGGAALG
jgi:formylglycine-generating enzyme required for sulfatase activity